MNGLVGGRLLVGGLGSGPLGPLNTDGQKTNVSSVHIHGFHNDSLRLTEIFLHI